MSFHALSGGLAGTLDHRKVYPVLRLSPKTSVAKRRSVEAAEVPKAIVYDGQTNSNCGAVRRIHCILTYTGRCFLLRFLLLFSSPCPGKPAWIRLIRSTM
jgi:hypothetical protein